MEGKNTTYLVCSKRKPTSGAARNCRSQSELPTSGKQGLRPSHTRTEPHRGHQPQLFLVAPLSLQQLPSGADTFSFPTSTLLSHWATRGGTRTLHAWPRILVFPQRRAEDSNSNRSVGGAAGVRPRSRALSIEHARAAASGAGSSACVRPTRQGARVPGVASVPGAKVNGLNTETGDSKMQTLSGF